MKCKIEVKRSAAKAIKKISKPDQKRISKAIDNLAENLPNPNTTKMKGDNPFHKIRVGDYPIDSDYQNRPPQRCLQKPHLIFTHLLYSLITETL